MYFVKDSGMCITDVSVMLLIILTVPFGRQPQALGGRTRTYIPQSSTLSTTEILRWLLRANHSCGYLCLRKFWISV